MQKSPDHQLVHINSQPIELCKLLKIANLVSGGGEAKVLISEGYVLLNDEVEYQKRKKIYENDIVEFNGEVIQVVLEEQTQDVKATTKNIEHNKQKPAKKKKQKTKNKTVTQPIEIIPTKGRKPISF
ncbi:MAG: RNA-binding S4 domain-containing protein [Alteromonadaceae bacterium]|nr:RNA-binding S4 domain-containing protein [Alteromonadaceae bacterium]